VERTDTFLKKPTVTALATWSARLFFSFSSSFSPFAFPSPLSFPEPWLMTRTTIPRETTRSSSSPLRSCPFSFLLLFSCFLFFFFFFFFLLHGNLVFILTLLLLLFFFSRNKGKKGGVGWWDDDDDDDDRGGGGRCGSKMMMEGKRIHEEHELKSNANKDNFHDDNRKRLSRAPIFTSSPL